MLEIDEIFNRLQCCYLKLISEQTKNVQKFVYNKEIDCRLDLAYSLLKIREYLRPEEYKDYVFAINKVCSLVEGCNCPDDYEWIGIDPVCETDGTIQTTTTTSTTTSTTSTSSSTTSSTSTTTKQVIITSTTSTTTTTTSTTTTSSTTTTTNLDCKRGPNLLSIVTFNSDGLQFLFDGDEVFSIKWRIKQGSTVVRNGIVNPTGNQPFISFSPFLTPGNYLLEIEGNSCKSTPSSTNGNFTIGVTSTTSSTTTTTNGGGGGGIDGLLPFSVYYSNDNL